MNFFINSIEEYLEAVKMRDSLPVDNSKREYLAALCKCYEATYYEELNKEGYNL